MSFLARIFGFIRRRKWTVIILTLIGVPVVLGISALTRPKVPEYVTAQATKGTLEQTVEAVGTIISEKNLNLQFRTSGIIADVFVSEGDTVFAGQRLATLRAGSLGASVAAARARVQETEVLLNAMRAGTRPEDIALAEAGLANKKASLEAARTSLRNAEESVQKSEAKLLALRQQAETSVQSEVSAVGSVVSQKITVAFQALAAIDDVYANNDIQDALVRDRSDVYPQIRAQVQSAKDALTAAQSSVSTSDYQSALKALDTTRVAVTKTSDILTIAYDTISSIQTGYHFTADDQATYKSTLATQRSNVQAALRDIDASVTSIRNLPAGLQTQIAAEESALQTAKGTKERASSDILTFETSVRIDEAQLQLKRAGSRPEDIKAAEARWRQALADLARAGSDYGDTVMTAPMAGLVTKVNVKEGEASPVGASINMIGNVPFRIEMYVSEVDIPKVALAQTGSIKLDAYPDIRFALRVGEIDPSVTDVAGVPKYRVKLDFVYPHPELKIGMTGDAVILTAVKNDRVSVPLRAVVEDAEGKKIVRVRKEDGSVEERPVTTGMEGEGGAVEVTGIAEGEEVVVLIKE